MLRNHAEQDIWQKIVRSRSADRDVVVKGQWHDHGLSLDLVNKKSPGRHRRLGRILNSDQTA